LAGRGAGFLPASVSKVKIMPTWLKYVLSIASGFGSAAATSSLSGGGTKGTLIGGALGAIVALGNLSARAPKDAAKLQ